MGFILCNCEYKYSTRFVGKKKNQTIIIVGVTNKGRKDLFPPAESVNRKESGSVLGACRIFILCKK